jgi:uncharacterized protein involved in exopolysaccharide biosynthesis
VIYTHVAAALLGAAIAAASAWHVQGLRWSGKVDRIEKHHAQAMQRAEAQARALEREMQANTERITNEIDKANARLADQSTATARTARGLRDEIARLNARPAPACPEAAAIFGEASTARDLLAACADEYREMAADADRLSIQVTGLQDWASQTCSLKK